MQSYLVIGQGSMGKRRVRCLLANGVPAEQVVVFDQRSDRLSESVQKHGVRAAGSVNAVLDDPETQAVFVSVPGALHLEYCLAAARAGKHWFCEVPLAVRLEGIDELVALTRQGVVGAPGCQVLFHPLAHALQAWAEAPGAGAILGGTYSFGSYLPEWHPHEDYRQFYASNQAMGGGNLDVIAQELTWLRWITNQPIRAVTCRMSKLSSLELAPGTPDHQELILEFDKGLTLSMHFDLNDRTHERWLRLYAETSTAKWSTLETMIHLYDSGAGKWTEERLPENFTYEICYQQEVTKFLRCIETGEPWPVSLTVAREIVQVLLAMQLSSKERRTVELGEVSK